MVQFGRSAPPVDPPQQLSSTLPPRTAHTQQQNLKGTQVLIIPPQFTRFCLLGFGAQVILDILVILVVYFQPAAFLATPRPIDVLMKNALSGIAWFMLAVINGSIISEVENPYPPFIVCLFTLYAFSTSSVLFAPNVFFSLVNIGFWCWTVWWGLNDRGPRSMYPQHQQVKRCFSCRIGSGGGMFNPHPHTYTPTHGRRPSMPRSFSPTEGTQFGGAGNGIALGPLSRQSSNTARMMDGVPSTPASPVLRGPGGNVPLRAREEPAMKIKEMPGVGVRASLGHQARQHSIASTLFSEGELAESACVDAKTTSPV
ncbi:hypothetical protein K440DRAFT_643680 [Wilcoxina mikolae CBS 423.85]|nr:hypothetical protein K440DRAFT_643680 [Wilcoxina mikolae CBS 423.85]